MEFFTLNINKNYEISKCGIVRNILTKKILKITKYKCGYLYVGLKLNKKTSTKKLHRLLAIMFIPNPDNLPTVDHINNIKDDNRLDNLRWASYKTQNNNKTKRNNKNYGYPITKYSIDNNFICKYDNYTQAAKSLNITLHLFIKIKNKNVSNVFIINGFKFIENTILLLPNEHLKPIYINNIDSGYKISNYGTLLNRKNTKTKGSKNSHGYLVCNINGKTLLLHRLIANAFLPNFYNKKIVNHKDGDKSNCKLYNLEWATRSENSLHSSNILKNGCVGVNQYDLKGNFIAHFYSIQKAADFMNTKNHNIQSACSGKSKTSCGFIWDFSDKKVSDENKIKRRNDRKHKALI